MSVSNKFHADEKGSIFNKIKPKPSSNIIKNQYTHSGNPIKIKLAENENQKTLKNSILPIKKDGEIIGFISECSCGEIVKVYFKYEEIQQEKEVENLEPVDDNNIK